MKVMYPLAFNHLQLSLLHG